MRTLLLSLIGLSTGCAIVSKDDVSSLNDSDHDGVLVDQDCDDGDPAVGATTPWYRDWDADGYGAADATYACLAPDGMVATATDCNDAAPTQHPGAEEDCNGVDDDCDGSVDVGALDAPTWYEDADTDEYGNAASSAVECTRPEGYVDDDTDCDDAAAGAHPGAAELCNGFDDDCDGVIDESDAVDATGWYTDADGDGFGSGEPTFNCSPPTDSADTDGDCDDVQAAVSPAAPEQCNGVDDDCDGATDEADAEDATPWYLDRDGDGWGAGSATIACAAPASSVAATGDCDDLRIDVNPDAEERCDGVDNDCDGVSDEPDATDVTPWYADTDLDGYGDPGVTTWACAAPSGYTAEHSDCDDTRASIHPGGVEVCDDGLDEDCDGTAAGCRLSGTLAATAGDAEYLSSMGDSVGWSVAPAGDMDGDGLADIVVGAPNSSTGAMNAGLMYVIYGYRPGVINLSGGAAGGLLGGEAGASLGTAVSGAGDFDGDGYDDFAAGAPRTANGGAVYIGLGDNNRWGMGVAGVTPLVTLTAEAVGDHAGTSLAGGEDIDGDGRGDLLIGASAQGTNGTYSGAAYMVLGGRTGTSSLTTAELAVRGSAPYDAVGNSVAWAGDVTGDGVGDLAVAGGSTVWLIDGSERGSIDIGAAYATFTSSRSTDGPQVAALGDITGDGTPDLLVGNYRDDTVAPYAGAAFVLPGGTAGAALMESAAAATVYGDAEDALLGWSVAAAGDLDQDGHLDLATGGPNAAITARSGGAVWLFYGPISGSWSASAADAVFTGALADEWLGTSVAGAGDIDDDGYPDLMMGAANDATAGASAGSVSIFRGAGL